jgi:large subunit ribosomal protein L13
MVNYIMNILLMKLTKLKIYSGSEHPHSAQNPKVIELDKLNNKNIARN